MLLDGMIQFLERRIESHSKIISHCSCMKGPLGSRGLCFSDKLQGVICCLQPLKKRAYTYEEITPIMKSNL